MPVFKYKTISKRSEGLYKEKGSRFIAFAFPVGSEREVKENLEKVKKEYFDARHHCYAYILGPEKDRYRANDDGEPNHSAGDPILGQLRAYDLTDVLIIVVRYFGGTKLGVGGLIAAYKTAAEDALKNTEIVFRDVRRELTMRYDYGAMPEVMKLVKDFELEIVNQSFDTGGTLNVSYKLEVERALMAKIQLLQSLRLEIVVDH